MADRGGGGVGVRAGWPPAPPGERPTFIRRRPDRPLAPGRRGRRLREVGMGEVRFAPGKVDVPRVSRAARSCSSARARATRLLSGIVLCCLAAPAAAETWSERAGVCDEWAGTWSVTEAR